MRPEYAIESMFPKANGVGPVPDTESPSQLLERMLPSASFRFRIEATSWNAGNGNLTMEFPANLFETNGSYIAAGTLAVVLAWIARTLHVRGTEQRMKAIMTERSRVAQELHDTLLQSVSGAAMEIQGAITLLGHGSIDLGCQQLSAALDHLGMSMAEARQAIWDLRSPDSSGMPIDQALESAARRLGTRGWRCAQCGALVSQRS